MRRENLVLNVSGKIEMKVRKKKENINEWVQRGISNIRCFPFIRSPLCIFRFENSIYLKGNTISNVSKMENEVNESEII